nr:hypothetical protein [Tanacetum cinerariifolium]
MAPYEAFACRCGKEMLFSENHTNQTPVPKENDYGCKFFYGKRNESVYYSVLWDLHRLQVIPQNLHLLIAIPQEVQHYKTITFNK